MSDICACPGSRCPLRDNCARYFEPRPGDTVFMSTPYNRATDTCDKYLNWKSVINAKKEKVGHGKADTIKR